MTEKIIWGQDTANGQIYQPNFHNRYCAYLNGAMETVIPAGTSSSVSWSAATNPRSDFGRYADVSLPGGIWFREEGYYVILIQLNWVWITPPTGGTVYAVLVNSTDTNYVIELEQIASGVYALATPISGGDWFARESYAYLQYTNNTDQGVDVYSKAFVHRVG